MVEKHIKGTFNCDIITLDRQWMFVGVQQHMHEDNMFNKAKEIARQYANVKGEFQHLITPVHTAAITFQKDKQGSFLYFMGDEVSDIQRLHSPLVSFVLKKGMMLAKVQVTVTTQLALSYKVAALRKVFYTKWLSEHGYQISNRIQEMELYHYRRRRFRKSLKLVMELYFFIEKDRITS